MVTRMNLTTLICLFLRMNERIGFDDQKTATFYICVKSTLMTI